MNIFFFVFIIVEVIGSVRNCHSNDKHNNKKGDDIYIEF